MVNKDHIKYANRHYASCVLIAIVCTVIMFIPDDISTNLVLSESGLTSRQWWRLVTAHFVHTNWWHYALNVAGLGLTWLLFYQQMQHARVAGAILVTTVGLSLVIWLSNGLHNIAWYAGLSGTLHGLFAFALVLELKQRRISTYALIVFGIGKLLYEQLGGSTDSTAALINASVAINAHLYGAILGTAYGFILLGIDKARKRQSSR